MLKFIVSNDDAGKRVDAFLAKNIPDHSRSTIQKLIKNGSVTYNGEISLSPKIKVATDATVELIIPEQFEETLPQPENIPFDIIYEDDEILVINKSPGVVVHPGAGTNSGTTVNALLGKFANFADKFDDKSRPGIVHRLDKDTSGCMIIAKDQLNLDKLISLFKRHKITKTYLAIVAGHLKEPQDTITGKIGRHPVNRKKMAMVSHRGKEAVTHYKLIDQFILDNSPASALEINLETGRTHQIRVHMASIHHPVLGDRTYGGQKKTSFPRQLLHAWKLTIIHPKTRETMTFTAPIPKDISKLNFAGVKS